MSNIEKQKAKFEKRLAKLAEEAYIFVKFEIMRVCDENDWDFRSLGYTGIYFRGSKLHDEEVEKCEASDALIDLVHWCDDAFGFPDCMYESGVWTP